MKSIVSALFQRITSYKALYNPLSIDPVLDGGIKHDIFDTLLNKATSKPILKLASQPSEDLPTNMLGEDGNYYLVLSPTSVTVYKKSAGTWSAIDSSNDMSFFNDGGDGVRRYYALSDDLNFVVLIHEIDFSDISGASVKYTEQLLTPTQQTQARSNILAASIQYVDNQIAALRKSGVFGTECSGTVKQWFGIESTIPTNWVKIGTAQTWYSKTEYASLYAALGGESNPWGLTTTQFSIPYFPDGSFVNKAGAGFSLASTGGESTHTLSIQELPAHDFKVANGGGDEGDLDANKTIAQNVGLGGNSSYRLRGNSGTATTGKTNTVGGGLAHNNMPPYVSAFWIIKLIDAEPEVVVESDLAYKTESVTTLSASGEVLVSSSLFIKDVNVLVVSGNPTLSIAELSTGQMSGQNIYSITVNDKIASGKLSVSSTGDCTIKVQIIKFNI